MYRVYKIESGFSKCNTKKERVRKKKKGTNGDMSPSVPFFFFSGRFDARTATRGSRFAGSGRGILCEIAFLRGSLEDIVGRV